MWGKKIQHTHIESCNVGMLNSFLPFCREKSELWNTRTHGPDQENILLLEGIHDLFVRREHIEKLWQAWGRPDIWRLPCGHISFPGGAAFNDRVHRWLAPRLNAPP
jgi:hypothetical protein